MHHTPCSYRATQVLLALLSLFLLTCLPAQAQEPQWKQLTEEVEALRVQGRFAQGLPVATQAVEVARSTFGAEHPNYAKSLFDLADLNRLQGNLNQSEQLHLQALAIREKALGPEHPDFALSVNDLGLVYNRKRQFAQAEPLFKRALAIREKALGLDHPDVSQSLNNLAILYNAQGQYAQAEPLYQRALAIREKALGPEHPEARIALSNLAKVYRDQGMFAQAEPLYKRALVITEKARGPGHLEVATILNNLAIMYNAQGQDAQAEPLFKRSLAIQEKAFGPEHRDVATTLNNLANVYGDQGQYAQAEPLIKRALAIREKVLGPEHPSVAHSLSTLAGLYVRQGQYGQAESLHKRALAILEKSLGPEHPDVAMRLNDLAGLYNVQGQYAQAELLFKRALAIYEGALAPELREVATTLNNLANVYRDQGQLAQAEPLYQRSLSILEKRLGDGPVVATNLHNLALTHRKAGQYAHAEPLYQRSLSIRQQTLSPDHAKVAESLNHLAILYQAQGQPIQALTLSRRASAITRQRIVAAGVDEAASREASTGHEGLFQHLSLLALNPANEPVPKLTDEALQTVQLAQASGTASAIAKMAARFASGSDALAVLAKRKQDAAQRRSKGEAQLVRASGQTPDKRDAVAEQRLRDELAQTVKELEGIDTELTQRFPAYQELARPEPVTVAKVQALLRPGEAMLVYGLDASGSYVWVVTPKQASFKALPAKRKDLESQVARVRSQMALDGADQGLKVSVDVLHGLYTSLFAPIAPELAGISHVMVVPTGPLQSLPFGMLVTAPTPAITTDADYRKVPWLIKKYAFSVLPSVSSIQAFRQFAKTQQAKGAFVGFGDPALGTESDLTRGARAKLDMVAVFRNVGAGVSAAGGADIADVDFIRGTPSLPETADELRNMARILKADASSVWLREQATETRVKTMDLSRYRTLAFATHGTLAGQISGAGEPGLLLTPPKLGTLEDDGYLSASEIAKLNLNANWVVLSACNTAAADGTPGAEGLSGMAKAFFYAGARSLLVSHWPVASEATVPLTTVMLKEYEAYPKQGKAQAQRKAILALMNTPGRPEYAHPLYWAPFVVVGEGGAGSRGN